MDMNPWNSELFTSSLLSSAPTSLDGNNAKPVDSSLLSLPPASLNLYDTESDHSSPANLPSASLLHNAEISTQIAAPTESSAPEEAVGNFRQRKTRHDPNNAAHLFLDEDDSVSIGSELGAKRQKLRDNDGDFVSGGRYTSPTSDVTEFVLSTDKSMGKRPRGKPSYDKSSKVTVSKVKRSKEAKPKIEVYYVNAQDGKPEPHSQPPVWGDKRQQICETLPYYNAYQGGAYRSEGVLYGFLTDKEVGPRDQFTDQILITSW